MTTFEHAMLGVNGVLACGLHRQFGWKLVALAGLAAIAPDWDGLTVLFDASVFDRGHRVWGHNVFACCLVGLLLGFLDYRFDLIGGLAKWITRIPPLARFRQDTEEVRRRRLTGYLVWIGVAVLAALSQIPADAVVSGGHGLGDWPIQVLWPVSQFEVVYPMVPWGDPGITIVFCIGMILSARFPARLQLIAIMTLLGVVGYIVVRGTML